MYVYVYKERAASGPYTETITDILCFPLGLALYQFRTSNELQDLTYGGGMIVTWRHKELAQATKP
jgi:hypothetical protein